MFPFDDVILEAFVHHCTFVCHSTWRCLAISSRGAESKITPVFYTEFPFRFPITYMLNTGVIIQNSGRYLTQSHSVSTVTTWGINISFQIWQSQVIDISSDKTTYVFENMPYNADLMSGTALMMTFNGVTIDGMVPESAVAYFSTGHVPEVTTITTASGTTKEVPITTSSTTTLPATSSPGRSYITVTS